MQLLIVEMQDIPPQWLAYDGDTVREALRRIRYTLETRLPDHTLPSLLSSRGVITDAEVHIVSGGSNPILKNRSLLDILMGKDTRVILQFFAMLKSHPDLTGYSELVEAFLSNIRYLQPKKRILQSKKSMSLTNLSDKDLSTKHDSDSYIHFPCTRGRSKILQYPTLPSMLQDKYSKLLVAVGQELSSDNKAKIHKVYAALEAQLLPIYSDIPGRDSQELVSLLKAPRSWGSLYRFACDASTPLDPLPVKIIGGALEKKPLQRKLQKYDRVLNEQLSALHLGACGSESIEVELEESGCTYFIAEVDNQTSLSLSAIPKLQSFLRDKLNLPTDFVGYHSDSATTLSSTGSHLGTQSPPHSSDQVILFLKTSAQKCLSSPDKLLPHCDFLLQLGMSRVGLHGVFLLKTDDCSVVEECLSSGPGGGAAEWDSKELAATPSTLQTEFAKERYLVIENLLADKQARLEEVKCIILFRNNLVVHGYQSLVFNPCPPTSIQKISDSSASTLHSLAEECDQLTQLCAYLREQLKLLLESTSTSDSEDESACTKDTAAAHPKKGGKTKCLPLRESCYNLQEMSWYWGSIDKGKTEEVLMSYSHGSFLVRDSTRMPGSYALAIRKEEGVITYLISDQNGLYGFMGSLILQFPTVTDLVDFCCRYSTLGHLKEGVSKEKHDDHSVRYLQQALHDVLRKVSSLESENALLKRQLEAYDLRQERAAAALNTLPVPAPLAPAASDDEDSA